MAFCRRSGGCDDSSVYSYEPSDTCSNLAANFGGSCKFWKLKLVNTHVQAIIRTVRAVRRPPALGRDATERSNLHNPCAHDHLVQVRGAANPLWQVRPYAKHTSTAKLRSRLPSTRSWSTANRTGAVQTTNATTPVKVQVCRNIYRVMTVVALQVVTLRIAIMILLGWNISVKCSTFSSLRPLCLRFQLQ